MPTSVTVLRECDIFLTRSMGLISRAIRFFTRHIGESRTKVDHVGIVVEGGPIEDAIVVEALSTGVVRHRLFAHYSKKRKTKLAVYRPINLTDEERATVVSAAENYVGRSYGYIKILAHFLDWLLQGAYVFRRLACMDDYPICSWVVAYAFAKASKTFGVEPGAASPDDIWDFAVKNPDKYTLVRPLAPLIEGAP